MINFPCCIGCTERYLGCRCQRYLTRKAEIAADKQAKRDSELYYTQAAERATVASSKFRQKLMKGVLI